MNNMSIKSNGMILNTTNQSNYNNNIAYANLPPELKITFEKLISQLDLVAKTTKINGSKKTMFRRANIYFI